MATTTQPIEFQDLERLRQAHSPDLGDAILRFIDQPDPARTEKPAEGVLTLESVDALLKAGNATYAPQSRRKDGREAWPKLLGQRGELFPPRLKLADFLVGLYEEGSVAGRAALVKVILQGSLRWGVWGGLKRVYKLAETRHDAELFGLMAWRFDTALGQTAKRDASSHTLIYLRRRAWRFLRELGRALPELYPLFAVETLRHYTPQTQFHTTWVANHIWLHQTRNYSHLAFSYYGQPQDDLTSKRAYDDAWKRSPEPLMRLLETCQSDPAARFAIQGLKRDFPAALRTISPMWLDRLARRPLPTAHEFLVDTLQASPEFHQSKLRGLGLHETVLALLLSPSQKARSYAIEYARAHAQDLSSERLTDLLGDTTAAKDTRAFAGSVLSGKAPREIGLPLLLRLLNFSETSAFAKKALLESYDRTELTQEFLADQFFQTAPQRAFVLEYVKAKYQPNELPVTFWLKLLDDPRSADNQQARRDALNMVGTYSYAAIGASWFMDALVKPDLGPTVSGWLRKAESLPGLDVERVKALVFSNQHRQLALEILGNPKLVKPRDLSLPWLLALARRADPVLNQFAHRFLLQNMAPADFADGTEAAGIEKLFSLALGAKEPEPVRVFAQTYLKCHHPVIGPTQPDTKAMDLKPQLPLSAYTLERLWPALRDPREDVRKFALTLAKADLRRWSAQGRVYELAESDYKEVRNLAYDALLKAGETNADPAYTLKPDEIDPSAVFGMTESGKRSTREVAVELVRKNYARLGGPERLAWLMESADREVRTFAVRLLWEKHRPRHLPPGWKPKGTALQGDDAGRFADVQALRGFLRRTLFGLPPGRSKEGRDDVQVRRLPASQAKRNVIEVVRDLGREDSAFALLVMPVLEEFSGSLAKMEWQACLSALVTLRAAHPGLSLEGSVNHV